MAAQRKMHTPIDEMNEEDEDDDDYDNAVEIEDDVDEECITDRRYSTNSNRRMTGSTVQTPSFLDKSQ